MYYFYVLKSKKDGKLYYGCTNDLKKRLEEHNDGKSTWTKNRGPFKIVYYEAYLSKEDAYQREHNIKLRSNAFTGLKRRIIKSVENG